MKTEKGFPLLFSYFLHRLATVRHMQDTTLPSYRNYCRIGSSIYLRTPKLHLFHSLRLQIWTQRSAPHYLISGQIFASLFANFICASVGVITGNLHCDAVGVTFGRTKYETHLEVSKSSKYLSLSLIDTHDSGPSLTLQILPRLISSVDHSVAMGILHHQRAAFMQLSQDVSAAPAAYGGIKHIDYLIAHWMPVPMWKSWSEWGRVAASTILNIPIEGVIPTTNHLESFNSILKRKHLPAHLRSGHRLRFDSLIHPHHSNSPWNLPPPKGRARI